MPEQTKNLLHCPKCNQEFPAQGRGRLQLIVDTIRANQHLTGCILFSAARDDMETMRNLIMDMHKQDRTALLQEGGILTDEQIELLK